MTIAEVEDALLEALRGAVPYAKTVRSYAGEWDEAVERVVMLFPAVLVELDSVGYEEEAYQSIETATFWEELVFAIWLASKSLRGEEEARRGAQGAYQMLEDVKKLFGKVLAQGLTDLTPQGVELMANSKGVVVYRVLVSVRQLFATS